MLVVEYFAGGDEMRAAIFFGLACIGGAIQDAAGIEMSDETARVIIWVAFVFFGLDIFELIFGRR